MEEKKAIKISLSTFLLILAVIIIAIMGVFIFKLNNEKNIETQKTTELQAQVNNLSGTVSNLQEKINTISATINTEQKETPTSSDNISTNINLNDIKYELIKTDGLFTIEIKDGNPYISTTEQLGIGKDKITTQKQLISGFKKKVIDVEIGSFETTDIENIEFIFLMEDGSVEHSSIQNMSNNLTTEGKINNLANIVRLQNVQILSNSSVGSGYISDIVAINNKGICYSLKDNTN